MSFYNITDRAFLRSDDFQKLYGGSIVRPPSDLLQGYLVLSLGKSAYHLTCARGSRAAYYTDEGEPWLDVVKREESIELMCQVVSPRFSH
jgi:hypothetical protein